MIGYTKFSAKQIQKELKYNNENGPFFRIFQKNFQVDICALEKLLFPSGLLSCRAKLSVVHPEFFTNLVRRFVWLMRGPVK